MDKVDDRDTYKVKLTTKDGNSLHVWIDAKTFLEAKSPSRNRIAQTSRNRPNRTLAIPAAVPAIPVNPRSAAIMAITRNMNAHLNMMQNAIVTAKPKGGVVLPVSVSGLQSNTITGKSKYADYL